MLVWLIRNQGNREPVRVGTDLDATEPDHKGPYQRTLRSNFVALRFAMRANSGEKTTDEQLSLAELGPISDVIT